MEGSPTASTIGSVFIYYSYIFDCLEGMVLFVIPKEIVTLVKFVDAVIVCTQLPVLRAIAESQCATGLTSGTKFLRPNASTGRRDTGRSERAPWTPPPLLAFRRHFPPDSAASSGAERRRTAPWRTRAAVCVHNCQFAFAGAQVFRRLKGKLNSFLMWFYLVGH